MIFTPHFHYNGECAQAMKLYEQAFDAKTTQLIRFREADRSNLPAALKDGREDYVYHAEMNICGQRFFLNDSANEIRYGRNLSIVVTFECGDELRKAYGILIEGGESIIPLTSTEYSSCVATLVDRFGIRWGLMV